MWKWGVLVIIVIGVGAGLVWGRVGETTGDYIEHTIQQTEFTGRRAVGLAAQNKVKDYVVKHGAYPASVDDIEGLPELPEGYTFDYDPNEGRITIIRE